MTTPHTWTGRDRLGGLRRFAVAITLLNILGHTWFGFEPSWAAPFVALATAYGMELLLESIDAAGSRRRPRFAAGRRALVDFLLSAHISGLAVGMLLYTNERLWPVAFAAAVAVGSKAVLRIGAAGTSRHVFNPSNFGITVALVLFPWISIAPPYQFTENLGRVGDWLLPGLIILSGSFLNWRFTRRLPLIAAWLTGFLVQAAVRSVLDDEQFIVAFRSALTPMTGLAFVLYTFYMVTDPATTPEKPAAQVAFGLCVAGCYGILMALHVVFGLFFALTLTSTVRALTALIGARVRHPIGLPQPADAPAPVLAHRVL